MKLTIHDFFDAFEEHEAAQEPSAERIKVLTMKKIEQTTQAPRSIRGMTRAIAAVAAVLALSVAVFAAVRFTGFMDTSRMSDREIQQLIEEIAYDTCTESVEGDGTVHYYDSQGNETLVLSAEEALQFEQVRQEAHEAQLQASQDLVDIDTIDLAPTSITPITTAADGSFGDFLLSNGSMAILHEADAKGYQLKAGDTVTITTQTTEVCYVEFGMVCDGAMLETEVLHQQQFNKAFTIPADGLYCFSIQYFSVSADNFTNCQLQIN